MPLRDKWTRCHVLELDLARVVRAAAEHAGGNHQQARSYAANLLDSPSA